MKKIIFSTSGSGGHTVPVKWLIDLLKQQQDVEIYFIGSKYDKTAQVIADSVDSDKYHLVSTGKYRRYANRSKWDELRDWRTMAFNLRDLLRLKIGLWQSYRLVKRIQPDLVFLKGGSVSLPVGLSANRLKIPIITHDSDTIAGFANKIVGKKAVLNLVGAKLGDYSSYQSSRVKFVGVPVSPKLHPVNKKQQIQAKKSLGFDADKPLLFVTGGSLGAVSLNETIEAIGFDLTKAGVQIFHQCGVRHEADMSDEAKKSWTIQGFVEPEKLASVIDAADLVITRGGSTIAHELSAQAKPAIFIPATQLSDQLSNAKFLQQAKVAQIMSQEEATNTPEHLKRLILNLLNDQQQLKKMSEQIKSWGNPDATQDIVTIIKENL